MPCNNACPTCPFKKQERSKIPGGIEPFQFYKTYFPIGEAPRIFFCTEAAKEICYGWNVHLSNFGAILTYDAPHLVKIRRQSPSDSDRYFLGNHDFLRFHRGEEESPSQSIGQMDLFL
jgi:hypothetical protein